MGIVDNIKKRMSANEENEYDSAYDDVRRQIGLQRLNGYYIMFEGQRIDIDSLGNASDNPPGFFDQGLEAVGDLLASDEQREALLKNIEHLYPQPVNPEVKDA